MTTLECTHCGTSFQCTLYDSRRTEPGRQRKYCSQVCYHAARVNKVETVCAHCGKTIHRTPYLMKLWKWHFCNKSCKAKFLNPILFTGKRGHPNPKGDQSPMWKGGTPAYYGPGYAELRERYKQEAGYRCQICGKKQSSQKLHIHHIIPFEQFGWERHEEANAPQNIQVVCVSCHHKIHETHKNFPMHS